MPSLFPHFEQKFRGFSNLVPHLPQNLGFGNVVFFLYSFALIAQAIQRNQGDGDFSTNSFFPTQNFQLYSLQNQ